MLNRVNRVSHKLAKVQNGHVSVILALSIVPIAVVAGFGIDFSMVATKKNKAQYTLDSAIISGSREMQSNASVDEVKLNVRKYFQAALSTNEGLLDCDDPTVTIEGQNLSATTICSQATTLSAIAGVDQLRFRVSSASTYGIGKVDVSFVFDVSGSMIGSRMSALKDAAIVAVDELLPDNPAEGHEEDIRISMVSYNNSLNAGPFFQAATGQEASQSYSYYSYYYRRWYNFPYTTTCVFQRTGPEKFTAAPPEQGAYSTAAEYWDREDCRSSKPVPLTTNRTKLVNHINNLNPSGGTAGHLGVAWGWYMISPDWWNGLQSSMIEQTGETSVQLSAAMVGGAPLAYDEPDSAKALILMTDGSFNATINNSQGSSTWQAQQLCDNIKETGVIIYSVAFQAPQSGEDVLNYCSSGPEFFFSPDNGQELTQAYKAIATSISDLRLTQ